MTALCLFLNKRCGYSLLTTEESHKLSFDRNYLHTKFKNETSRHPNLLLPQERRGLSVSNLEV